MSAKSAAEHGERAQHPQQDVGRPSSRPLTRTSPSAQLAAALTTNDSTADSSTATPRVASTPTSLTFISTGLAS